jgi:hypothetical protein
MDLIIEIAHRPFGTEFGVGRVEDWRAEFRLRRVFRRFRVGPSLMITTGVTGPVIERRECNAWGILSDLFWLETYN